MIVLNKIFTPIPPVRDVVQLSTDNGVTWIDFDYSTIPDPNDYDRPAGYYIHYQSSICTDGTAWIRMNNGKTLNHIRMFNSLASGTKWVRVFDQHWTANETEEGGYMYYNLYWDVLGDPEYPEFMTYGLPKLHLTLD